MLLFADGTVLFSYTARGPQILLNKLEEYCKKQTISVNTSKTVAMVCKKGSCNEHVNLCYGYVKFTVIQKFVYLGNFYNTQKQLSEQALHASYSLHSLFGNVHMSKCEG